MDDTVFKEIMQYTLIILCHALSWWLLSGAFRARERNYMNRNTRNDIPHHNRDKEELMEELHKHRGILALNRLDNIEKGLDKLKE